MSAPVTYFCTAILNTIYAEFFHKTYIGFFVKLFDIVDLIFIRYLYSRKRKLFYLKFISG